MKKFLSILLSIILMVSICPLGVFEFTVSAYTYSGTCGDNLTWKYDSSDNTLTISGSGAMDDYSNISYNDTRVSGAGWGRLYGVIYRIIINDGVTSIGNNAFYNCQWIKSIAIPNSVKSIGTYAFYNWSALTSITIPNSVKSIGSYAFSNCNKLKKVNYDGDIAGWCNISFDSNPSFTELNLYIGDDLLTDLIIPDSVTSIGNYAFANCTELMSVTITDSVKSIGKGAFYHCTALKTAGPIGDGYDFEFGWTDSIPSYAFYGCTGLKSISIPDSVTSIGDYNFWCCTELTNVTLGNSVESIGNMAFHGCTRIESITIPDSVKSIGDNTFGYCTSLSSVTIPNSVTSIGKYALSDTAWYNNQSDGLVYAGKVVYKYKGTCPSSVIIEHGTLGIAGDAFSGCTMLTNITIPDSVTSIGVGAFYGCTGLKSFIYCGKPEQWASISIGKSNGCLTSASISYHLYNDWYFSLKPTCTTDGTEYSFCDICGNKEVRIRKAYGHSYKNKVDERYLKSAANCLHGNIYYKSCSLCGNASSETFESGSTIAHKYVDKVDEKYLKAAADCTHAAVYFKSCSFCGYKPGYTFVHGQPLGHDYDYTHIIVVNPTCTEKGYTMYTCSRCQYSYKYNYTYMPCGGDCGFIIENNTLYIHGMGDINNYKTQASVPWYDYANQITETQIDEGITKIGNYAFYCLENLKSIKSKNNNLSFGKYALNDSNTGITVFTENGGSLEAYCTKNNINYIDPTITPELETVTDNSITVKAVEGYKYSLDGATWQKSNIFTRLSPASEYNIYARYAATADIFDTVGAPLIVMTLKSTVAAPAAPDYQSHTENLITLKPNDLYEYSKDGENWQKSNVFENLDKNIIYRFYQRVAETETEYASTPSAALIIAIPDKPVILEAGYDSVLVKLVDGFEYCLDDMVWQDSNSFDKLIDNTEYLVYQRLKAVEGEKVYRITSEYTAVTTDNSIVHTHTLGEWLYNEQNHWRICADCGEKFDEAAHTPGDWITDIEPTTETAGHKHTECTVCGCVLAEEDIPQLPTYIPGDINGDGAVNNKDLTRLFQYLSDWDVEVNEAALDVNGDGSVNNKDLTRLFQYLSDWDVEIF